MGRSMARSPETVKTRERWVEFRGLRIGMFEDFMDTQL